MEKKMPKYNIYFTVSSKYIMQISAKDEEEVSEKLQDKIDRISLKKLEEFFQDYSVEIEEINLIEKN